MTRKFKVYVKSGAKSEPVYMTHDYSDACAKESELKDKGHEVFVWEI